MKTPDAQDKAQLAQLLVDHVPSMLAYWDAKLVCRFANRAYKQWFGLEPEQVIGIRMEALLGPVLFAQNERFIRGALQGQLQTFERILPGPDGIRRHSLATYIPDVVDGMVQGFMVQVTEVTKLKETEAALRASEALLDRTGRIAGVGGWEMDLRQGKLEWSAQTFRIHDIQPGEAPSLDDAIAFYAPESRAIIQASVQQGLLHGTPWDLELPFITATGRHRWVRAVGEVEFEEGQAVRLFGSIQDITEHKQVSLALLESQRQLRNMAAQREVEREIERKHMAREVHDELGQLLTSLKMDLALLAMHITKEPAAQRIHEDMGKLVERTFEVVRSVATSLRPAVLDIGLTAALEWLVEDFSLRWDTLCKLEVEGAEVKLGEVTSTAIFRVVQESLTNVARHAASKHVLVRLSFDANCVGVVVQDDGRGFDSRLVAKAPGFGLLGMKERVLSLGGQLRIDSHPGLGTSISLEVPIRASHDAQS